MFVRQLTQNLTSFQIIFNYFIYLLRCDTGKYYDTSGSTPTCSIYFDYFYNIFLFCLFCSLVNKKSFGMSCTDIENECDNEKGLSCQGTGNSDSKICA